MGEMADFTLDQIDEAINSFGDWRDHEEPYFRHPHRAGKPFCIHCGFGPFSWEYHGAWLLVENDGSVHDCRSAGPDEFDEFDNPHDDIEEYVTELNFD